jgi:hypothetical protein
MAAIAGNDASTSTVARLKILSARPRKIEEDSD